MPYSWCFGALGYPSLSFFASEQNENNSTGYRAYWSGGIGPFMQVSVVVTLEVQSTGDHCYIPEQLAEGARQAVENSCRYFEQPLGLPHAQWTETRVCLESVELLRRD